MFCYGYLIKDFLSVLIIQSINKLHTDYHFSKETEEVISSTETSMSEQKHSYIWSLVDKHVTRLHTYWFDAINILHESEREHPFLIALINISIWFLFIIPCGFFCLVIVIILVSAEVMSSCCTEKPNSMGVSFVLISVYSSAL